ncbi:hypothetical protein [uncultured Bacteroides sp.]|uniref:hypothetical protein n=1 Tax=uncultured Bacteroides sp. TaxID=162156 RepID=UPI002AAB44F5|nr:hypothetical protein [uncultured Bacteroides sp.]
MVENIINILNECPSYIGEGMIELIMTVVGGLILGYFTSSYMAKINEINRVEGLLLEKKMPIYKGIFGRLEDLNEMVIVPRGISADAIKVLNDCGYKELDCKKKYQLSKGFDQPDILCESYLSLDKYISENKLYFDDITNYPILVFQNYFSLFNRFDVMFKEQVQRYGINLQKAEIQNVRRQMFVALGIVLKDDFHKQIQNLQDIIHQSMNNLTMKHRSDPDYSYEFFSAENGYMMQKLMETRAMKDREKINKVITTYIALVLLVGGIE